jgi:hypothetical protein
MDWRSKSGSGNCLFSPVVRDVFGDERTQSQPVIQLAHQKQSTVEGDSRTSTMLIVLSKHEY